MLAKRLTWIFLLISFSLLTPTLIISSLLAAAGPTGVCNVPGDQPTIQAAVSDVTCDTINLTNGVYVENVVVGRTVTIRGQGALSTAVDGDGIGSVLEIQSSGVVTLTDLTITNGLAAEGGGIKNFGTVSISNSTISSNTAASSNGGGIYNFFGGTVSISNSTLSGNTATNSFGGGIWNNGMLNLTNSTLISNSADIGGGIYNIGGTLSISNTTINGNKTTGNSFGGGGIFNINGTLNLINSTLSGNTTTGGGGGVRNQSVLTLINSTLISNTASGGGGVLNQGVLTLTNSTLISNSADIGGGIYNFVGGTLSISNSTLSGNTATNSFGGGIFNLIGTFSISDSTLSGNTAGISGGGIVASSGGKTNMITNSTLSGNIADVEGGGIWNSDGALSMTNSTLISNTADVGGGIWNTGRLIMTNSMVANSSSGGDCYGVITSQGYNIDSDNTCDLTATGDKTNTNPRLGPLQDNGGDTLTHALLSGSPAINQIPFSANGCGTSVTTDQRGVERPQGIACDIGAFEAEFFPIYLPILFKG